MRGSSSRKVILKISQAKEVRDPECGCTLEPLALLRRSIAKEIVKSKRGDPEGGEK